MSKGKQISGKAADMNVMPGFTRASIAEVMPLLGDAQLCRDDLPPGVNESVAAFAHDAMRFAFRSLDSLQDLSREQRIDFGGMLAYATHMGFAMALHRYADELKRVPELKKWHREREAGVNKGHATQSQAREARYQRILDKWAAMEKAGERPTNETVAAAIRQDGEKKCSARTVQRAFAELTAKAKPAKRKKR